MLILDFEYKRFHVLSAYSVWFSYSQDSLIMVKGSDRKVSMSYLFCTHFNMKLVIDYQYTSALCRYSWLCATYRVYLPGRRSALWLEFLHVRWIFDHAPLLPDRPLDCHALSNQNLTWGSVTNFCLYIKQQLYIERISIFTNTTKIVKHVYKIK